MKRWAQVRDNRLSIIKAGMPPTSECLEVYVSNTDLSVIKTRDGGRWHLSIAHPYRYPSWNEIHEARYRFLPPDMYVAMILPPRELYVNLHPNAFHLWEVIEQSLIWYANQM